MNKSLILFACLIITSLSLHSQSIVKIEGSEIAEECHNNKNYYKQYASETAGKNAKGILLIKALRNLQQKIATEVSIMKDSNGEEIITLDSHLKIHGLDFTSISSHIKDTDFENYSTLSKLVCNQYIIKYEFQNKINKIEQTTTYKEVFHSPKTTSWYNKVTKQLEDIGFEYNYKYEENIHEACISIRKDLINKK